MKVLKMANVIPLFRTAPTALPRIRRPRRPLIAPEPDRKQDPDKPDRHPVRPIIIPQPERPLAPAAEG